MAKRKRNYVNNPEFYQAMVEYKKLCKEAEDQGKEQPQLPNYVGECIYQIANRLAQKPNFFGYSYKDDMISDGLENAVKCAANFNPEKSNNPFAYFTQVIWFAFLRRIEKEKKQLYVKHKIIEHSVLTDTAMTRGDHGGQGSEGSAEYIDLNNEYMSDFVETFEANMQKKRDRAKANAAKNDDDDQ